MFWRNEEFIDFIRHIGNGQSCIGCGRGCWASKTMISVYQPLVVYLGLTREVEKNNGGIRPCKDKGGKFVVLGDLSQCIYHNLLNQNSNQATTVDIFSSFKKLKPMFKWIFQLSLCSLYRLYQALFIKNKYSQECDLGQTGILFFNTLRAPPLFFLYGLVLTASFLLIMFAKTNYLIAFVFQGFPNTFFCVITSVCRVL